MLAQRACCYACSLSVCLGCLGSRCQLLRWFSSRAVHPVTFYPRFPALVGQLHMLDVMQESPPLEPGLEKTILGLRPLLWRDVSECVDVRLVWQVLQQHACHAEVGVVPELLWTCCCLAAGCSGGPCRQSAFQHAPLLCKLLHLLCLGHLSCWHRPVAARRLAGCGAAEVLVAASLSGCLDSGPGVLCMLQVCTTLMPTLSCVVRSSMLPLSEASPFAAAWHSARHQHTRQSRSHGSSAAALPWAAVGGTPWLLTPRLWGLALLLVWTQFHACAVWGFGRHIAVGGKLHWHNAAYVNEFRQRSAGPTWACWPTEQPARSQNSRGAPIRGIPGHRAGIWLILCDPGAFQGSDKGYCARCCSPIKADPCDIPDVSGTAVAACAVRGAAAVNTAAASATPPAGSGL